MRAVGARTPNSPWREPPARTHRARTHGVRTCRVRTRRAQTYQSDGSGMSELSVSTDMTALCGNGVTCPNKRYHSAPERPVENGRSPQTPRE
ncbi:hypothetical protein GCM10027161_28730 [Microbispora hainanensis]